MATKFSVLRWINHPATLTLLISLVAIAAASFTITTYHSYKAGYLKPQFHHGGKPSKDIVQSWMTFDYLNKIFNLEPQYLKDQLQIHDTRYPKLSIKQYAERNKSNSDQIIGQIKDALNNYQP